VSINEEEMVWANRESSCSETGWTAGRRKRERKSELVVRGMKAWWEAYREKEGWADQAIQGR
jgi:hypothetical protein